MLGIIPRSGVLKSKFRNSSGLKKKKRLPEFLSGILVGEERRVVFVLSESPPRGEAGGAHWVMGMAVGPPPSLLCTLQGKLPSSRRHFRAMAKIKRLGFQGLVPHFTG